MTRGVEIITIGDELLRGEVVDTNSSWLAARLLALGLRLERVTSVGDDFEPLVERLREAAARSEVVLTTGGLGPTDDDRTTAAVARAVGVELEPDGAVLEGLRQRWARAGWTFTKNNEKQAFFPKGATILENDHGTAPGFLARTASGSRIASMPGIPAEMKPMWEEKLAPILARELAPLPALVRSLNLFGLGESQMDALLVGLLDGARGSEGACEVTLHTKTTFPENRAILVVRPADRTDAAREGAARLLAALEAEARVRLGRSVFGADDETFSGAVVRALRTRRARLAIAESCSGGLAADLLTQTPGSSDVFELGLVCYANRMKEAVLNVPAEVLERHGAVSRECAEAMARNVRALADADLGVSVTGIAGPGGGSDEKPVGTVHFALATASGVRHLARSFPFERQRVKLASAYTALALALRHLEDKWPEGEDLLEGRWAVRRDPAGAGRGGPR
jgi:nicotinamide-nucleotide amidase